MPGALPAGLIALFWVRWRDVAASRSGLHAPTLEPDRERVGLAVANGRRESEDVLAVELLRHTRERGTELVGFPQLEVPATRLLGELPEAAVGAAADPEDFDRSYTRESYSSVPVSDRMLRAAP